MSLTMPLSIQSKGTAYSAKVCNLAVCPDAAYAPYAAATILDSLDLIATGRLLVSSRHLPMMDWLSGIKASLDSCSNTVL